MSPGAQNGDTEVGSSSLAQINRAQLIKFLHLYVMVHLDCGHRFWHILHQVFQTIAFSVL